MGSPSLPTDIFPAEIWIEIFNHLFGDEERVRLSSISKAFRSFFGPLAFRTLWLENVADMATGVCQLSKLPMAQHVRKLDLLISLKFEPSRYLRALPDDDYGLGRSIIVEESDGEDENDEDEEDDGDEESDEDEDSEEENDRQCDEEYDERYFPPSLQEALSNLGLFPNLEELNLSFLFRGGLGPPMEERSILCWEFDDRYPYRVESPSGWQRVIAKTYAALAKNSQVASLSILRLDWYLPFHVPEVWLRKEWQDFMSTISTFELSWAWYSESDGMALSSFDDFQTTNLILNSYLVRHLPALETLILKGNSVAPINDTIEDDCEGTLNPNLGNNLTCLRTLELHCAAMHENLVEFILARRQTLQRIKLFNCYFPIYGVRLFYGVSTWSVEALQGTKWEDNEWARSGWADVFDRLRMTGMPKLIEFRHEVRLEKRGLLMEDDSDSDADDPDADREPDPNWLSYLASVDDVFVYGQIEEQYGDFVLDQRKMIHEREKGEDQKAFDAFCNTLGARR